MKPLSEYTHNVTSQFGEDGVIAEIFRRIGTSNKICVEFGAWDGKYLSNTWNLWHNSGWNGVLIEGDAGKYQELVANYGSRDALTLIHAYVGTEGESSLDSILSRHKIPRSIDLLSIDIDGDDYHVFSSIREVAARVVVLEFNPTIPPHISVVQGPGEYFGASALAIHELLSTRGYILAACTEANSFYVTASEFGKLEIEPPLLADIFPGTQLTYVITAFDGRTFLSRNPVYAREIPPENLRALAKKFYRYYFKEYHEHVNIGSGGGLLPAVIYYNHFFHRCTTPFSRIVCDFVCGKVRAKLRKLPLLGKAAALWERRGS